MQSVDNKPGTVSELLPHVASNFQLPTCSRQSVLPVSDSMKIFFSPAFIVLCRFSSVHDTHLWIYPPLFFGNFLVTVNSDYRDCCWIFPSVGDTFVRWKHLQCFCTFSGIGVIVYSVPTPAITLSGTSQQLVLQVTSLFSPSNKSASTNFLSISCTYICIPYFLHITEQLFQFTFFNRDAKNWTKCQETYEK